MSDAKCTTFICFQAENVPQNGATMIGDGGCQDWLSDANEMPSYSHQVVSIMNELNKVDTVGDEKATFLQYGIRDY